MHKLPADLREALIAKATVLDTWEDITPGQRRPCCWPGCKHRERTGRA